MVFELAASTPVMVGADAGLIHTRDERRAIGGADRGGDKRPGEHDAVGGHAIEVGRFNGSLTVARKVGRHVIGDNPEDVGPIIG